MVRGIPENVDVRFNKDKYQVFFLPFSLLNAIAAYATPYLLVNNSIALLPVKVVDMFVGDVRQRPGLGSALSLVLLTIVLLEIGLTNLCKKHFEKGI